MPGTCPCLHWQHFFALSLIFQYLYVLTGEVLCWIWIQHYSSFLTSCLVHSSVWNCVALCIHGDLVWAALSFPLSQRMLYRLSINSFSKRGWLAVWTCTGAHYVGLLIRTLAVEASLNGFIQWASLHVQVSLKTSPLPCVPFLKISLVLPNRLVQIEPF